MKILMCEPDFFEVTYRINPWMEIGAVDKAKAVEQWTRLKEVVHACGAIVDTIKPIEGLPDMVFTANAGLVLHKRILLSHFKYPERQGEREHFAKWFKDNGFKIVNPDDTELPFEGAGDALFVGDTLVVAHGFRSDPNYLSALSRHGLDNVIQVELVSPEFYHLDTCFCPLDDKSAMWWPEAFTKESQALLQERFDLLFVPQQDAMQFACNAVVIGKQVIVPAGVDQTMALLEQHGFMPLHCDMSEFMKAGGACKCLTLVVE